MTKQKKPVKMDSYNETFKGAGTDRAHSGLNYYYNVTQFYIDNPLARKIIDVIPEEMVFPGFGIDGETDEKEFKSRWDAMKMNEQIVEAFAWERLYGGSAIVAVINDRRALTSPAKEGAPLESIRVYEKEQVKIQTRETNPRNSRYGMPKTYTINPGGSMPEYEIHHSRIYINDGDRIPGSVRRQNEGWGASVLSRGMIDAITDYDYCEELATQLLRRKQQAVWKARGLADLCDDDEGRYAARIRLAQVDDNSGVGRAVGIDANDEEYEILNSDINGVDAFLDKKMDRIVNYSGIHEIILKNKNVGGVSASQNTALETFYKMIDRRRNERYRPLLEWLLPFMIQEQEWSIRFDPLSMPSEKEQAETFERYTNAVDKLITNQAIDTEEARDTLESVSDVLKLKSGLPKLPPRDKTGKDQQGKEKVTTLPKGATDEGSGDS